MTNTAFFTPSGWPEEIQLEVRKDAADPEIGQKEGCTIKDAWLETKRGSKSIVDWLEDLTGGLNYEALEKEAAKLFENPEE